MKKFFVIVLGVCLVAMFAGNVSARDIDRGDKEIARDTRGIRTLIDTGVPGSYQAVAQADTYYIVKYDFESGWQGWTDIDYTAQRDLFWHATNFDGDPDPAGGKFFPINGSWSMWCGTPGGDDDYLCGFLAAPGYGNNWDQSLVSDELTITESAGIDFTMVHHVEGGGWDEVYLEYEGDDGSWVNMQTFGTGSCDTAYVTGLVDTGAVTDGTTKFRIHFVSDGAWSDEDGLLNTSGACIVDDIVLSVDGATVNTEDFETATQGQTAVGWWTGEAFAGYVTDHPDYTGPSLRTGMTEADPCTSNFGAQIEFFEGNVEDADQTIYSGLFVTPRCLNGGGFEAPCQADGVISPDIDMTKYSTGFDEVQDADIPSGELAGLGGVLFRFEVYRDLPLANLVFYTWSVRNVIDGCPQAWQDRGYVYYGPDQDYLSSGDIISDLVVHPDSTMQLTFGVQDMCSVWGGYYGDCANHTPTPWIDDIRVYRYQTTGPQWTYRDLDIFSDTFPWQSATAADTCRSDAANDITADEIDYRIDRGDSAVIEVTSPIAGALGTDPTHGGAAVYIHVKAENPQDATSIAGASIVGANDGNWMKYISDDGTWTVLRGDTARLGNVGSRGIALDNYMFDLNDSLFTKGYIVEYYFSAMDANGATGYLPTNALEGGAFEFTCLPLDDEVDVLYVDDYDGRGSWDGLPQDYWDPAFASVMSAELPERYDIHAPSSHVGNGLESCVDAADLGLYYNTIIWDSGDLSTGTIGCGGTEETNDAALLEEWFTDQFNHNHKTNLLVMGERMMLDLTYEGAISFQTNVLGCELDRANYYDCTGGFLGGGVIYPTLVAVTGGAFDGLENFAVDGGCPGIQKFDMLSLLGETSSYALQYEENCESETKYAAVANDKTTLNVQPARAMTCAFSMMQIRDLDGSGALVRNEFFKKVLEFFAEGVNLDITGDDTTPKYVTKLGQNYPNPFNPSTEIKFSLKNKSKVTIRVYDVSGRLVNTLVDGVLDAGPQKVNWNGINSHGSNVASGVYFYRMDTKDYSESKKMILLR